MIDRIELRGHPHRVVQWKSDTPSDKAVIALHGFGTNATRSFREVFPGLTEASIDVIAPDLLGFGESDKPNQVYTLHQYAHITADLAAAYALDKPVLLGHSLGGKIAAAAAALHPGKFSALILVNPGGFSIYAPWIARLGGSRTANSLLTSPWCRQHILGRTALRHFVRDDQRLEELERFRRSHAALDLKASKVWHHLPSIDVPSLLLWGVNDRILPRSTPHRIRAAIPDIDVQFLADCGHVPMIDQPSVFVAAVLGFLIANRLLPEPA